MAPNRNIVKAELVPPQIKHELIEAQDPFSRDAHRRRSEIAQVVVDKRTLIFVNARQQMPKRKSVAFAG